MKLTNSCKKMNLPNGKVVDILSTVLDKMENWIQDTEKQPEAGGYIVGYQHLGTENITLEDISQPCELDKKSRLYFGMRDSKHQIFLKESIKRKSYYMGVWHTHPQMTPSPSDIDWKDWYDTLEVDRTGCEYIFFIIAGIKEMRVWVGDIESKEIVEIFECPSNNGIYITQREKKYGRKKDKT